MTPMVFGSRGGGRWSGLMGTCLVLACGGAGHEPNEDFDGASSAAPESSNPQAASGSPTTEALPTGTQIPSTPLPTVPVALEPSSPEVLLDGLDYPARLAVVGEYLYVSNRRSSRFDGSFDQMLRLPLSLTTSPEVLFEHTGIDEFAVTRDVIWVTSFSGEAAIAFDIATGMQIEEARVLNMHPVNVTLVGTACGWATRGSRHGAARLSADSIANRLAAARR